MRGLERVGPDVWTVSLDQDGLVSNLVSASERARCLRMSLEVDRRRCIARHALLRCLLSKYLGRPAANIEIARSRFGKPHVVDARLEFSVTSRAGHAAFAFSEKPIGIDLEIDDGKCRCEVVADHFTAREKAALANVAAEQQAATFFKFWTAKEAGLKAAGIGLWDGGLAAEVVLADSSTATIRASGRTSTYSITHEMLGTTVVAVARSESAYRD